MFRKKPKAEPQSKGVFIDSLETVSAEELGAHKKEKVKKKLINGVSDILLLGCIGVFVICAIVLISNYLDSQNAIDMYGSIAEGLFEEENKEYYGVLSLGKDAKNPTLYNITELLDLGISGEVSSSVPEQSEINIQIERVKSRLAEMEKANPDIYGYIKIDDTNISLPFVLGEDNEFYLVHDPINRGYLDSGSIFADYRCSPLGVEYNRNTVLYGHNMTRGIMFADLKKFLEEDFFRSHLIYVYTETGLYVYQPFSIFKTNERHQYFRVIFDSEDDYLSFLTEMQSLSMFETDLTLSTADKILTLSTCTNILPTGRYCLQAKLIKVEK